MNGTPNSVRVCEANTREALRKVRAALGADALVLSTRRTAAGVEVFAMSPHALEAAATGRAFASTTPQASLSTQASLTPQAPSAPEVLGELRALSDRLSSQIGQLGARTAGDPVERPARTEMRAQLERAGFGEALAGQLAGGLPDDYGPRESQAWLRTVLGKNLACAAQGMIERGGIYALVGPTGVGKTTTVAKLAARCVVKHGPQSLGLVTTDSYRIGAFDQLRIYGRILGVPVHAASDEAELGAALESLKGRRLVLIDTVGIGQRDARMRGHLASLARPGVQQVLVLSASSQPEVLDEAAGAFRGRGLAGAVITKLDEAVKVGGALGTLIRHRLPLFAVATGQRVPEDLHPANGPVLIERALRAVSQAVQGGSAASKAAQVAHG